MPMISPTEAANLATQCLAISSFPHDPDPTVSIGAIRDMVACGMLTGTDNAVDRDSVEHVFRATRVIDGRGYSIVRASVTPMGPSGPTDRLPQTLQPREWAGVDIANTRNLQDWELAAAVEGVWPASEEDLRRAMLLNAYFLPAVKGFVHGSLIRTVAGYHLDLTTRRRWIETRELTPFKRDALLPRRERFEHVWISVPRGPISAVKKGDDHAMEEMEFFAGNA